MRDAEAAAAVYDSRYIRDYCRAARGSQELVFGDLAAVIAAGYELVDNATRTIQVWGSMFLTVGGLLSRDAAAIAAAISSAERAVARQVPGSDQLLETASYLLDMLRDQPGEHPPVLPDAFDPWLAARDAVNRNDLAAANARVEQMLTGGATRQAMAHAITGLLDGSQDEWHQALQLAGAHGLRLIAVDALEALGAAAANGDSSAEALRLLAAADRLRQETGYRWRFNLEQQRFDTASRLARGDLEDGADGAWREGLALDLPQAVTYARRARGERARPRHGWESLTPTERQVVDLVADGLTNPEIAERLLMARGTVKTHLEHAYAKTGLRNRAELAAAVTQHKHEQP
jgi:DNA-binding CsgD family transcriptional regulator